MIRKIKKIIGRHYSKMAFIFIMYILSAIIDTVAVYMTYPLIYAIIQPNSILDNQYVKMVSQYIPITDEGKLIGILSLIIAFIYIFRNIFMLILEGIKCNNVKKCQIYVFSNIFKMISERPYYWFTDTNTSDIQKICIKDINCLVAVIESGIKIGANIFSLIFLVLVLALSDFSLTISAGIIVIVITVVINMPITKRMKQYGAIYGKEYAEVLKNAQQFVGILKNVLTNRNQKYFLEKYKIHVKNYSQNESKYKFFSVLPSYIMNIIIMAFVFLYIAFMAFGGVDVSLRIPTLAMFGMAAMKLLPAVSSLISNYNNMLYNKNSIDILYEQMKLNDLLKERELIENEKDDLVFQGGIFLSNISFKYMDAEDYLFTNISLQIPINKSVAFVGPTGSGKTTLADIILGLHRPDAGNVLAGKYDVRVYSGWWAKQIGYIPQNVYLLEDTIRCNVALGWEKEDIDDEKVWECLRQAQMEEYVYSLPDRLETITGENGVKLSGGQRQRIGIARALYGEPNFIVLDEATSALDNETEKVIMEAINNLAGNKTLLIIAHRLSTIEKCDIVYKIENGVVSRER